MIRQAILYVPDTASSDAAWLPLAGRATVTRALVAAWRAGVVRIGIPTRLRDPRLDQALGDHPELARAVVWLGPEARPWPGPTLLLPMSGLVDAPTIRALLASALAPAALEESKGTTSPLMVAPPTIVSGLWSRLAAGEPIGDELEDRLRAADVHFVPAASLFLSVTDARLCREGERVLYRRAAVGVDSRIDVHVHRRLSGHLTRRLVRFPAITPNHVTLVSLIVGLGAAACFLSSASLTAAVLGLLLYGLSVVIDHADGEVARLTFRESVTGERLDFVSDTAVHAALVLGLGLFAERAAGAPALALGAAAATGVVMSAVTARFLPAAEAGLGIVLRGMGNRDLFYALLVGFILARAAAPAMLVAVMLVLAVGSQAYWITSLLHRMVSRRHRAAG